MTQSVAQSLASLPEAQREQILQSLTPEQAHELQYEWRFWARPDQLPPEGDWFVWVLQSGRGAGKTRAGAEWVRSRVEEHGCKRVALVARTAADARDTMIEGESGILAISPPWNMPQYEPSKRRMTWPNGAIATTYTAEEAKALRGPQHDAAWCDELATWADAGLGVTEDTTWSNLLMGLRIGADPRAVVTTTPRNCKLFKMLIAGADTIVTRARTYDNLANLAEPWRKQILRIFEGTRLGRQELDGELIEDVEGALWTRAMIDGHRVAKAPTDLTQVVVAIDPAVTATESSSQTGIVVAGRAGDHAYILRDATGPVEERLTPHEWASRAVAQFDKHAADKIIGEVNNGGDLVEGNIRTVRNTIPFDAVRASRGKQVRAQPVASLYEQGRIHHVGTLPELEDQLCTWAPGLDDSPDRLDALVWAVYALGFVEQERGRGMAVQQSGRKRMVA